MIPWCASGLVILLLQVTVILILVFSTSCTKQCKPTSTEGDGPVIIRNVGIKLCQLKCDESGQCLSIQYNGATLTCRLLRAESRKTKTKEGYVSLRWNLPEELVPESCSMGMAGWEFVQFVLTITITYSEASQSCDILTFRHHGSLDGQMFNDTFITEVSVSDKAACFWRCLGDLQCNMVLHNPATQRCRLYYSSIITGGEQDQGWQYYTVACSDFRILNALSVMSNQTHVDVTCSNGFSYLPTTSGKCFHDNSPIAIGRCMQTTWIDPVRVFSTPLPAPLASGAEIVVEAAADGEKIRNWVRLSVNEDSTIALGLFVRWNTLDMAFNTRSSGVWSTELTHQGVVYTPNVISNLSIKITDTEFLISVDDNNVLTAPIRIPVQDAKAIAVDFTVIKRLQLKYP